MAGGRGAPGRGRDEPQESYLQRQDHELQALEAIYGADFQDLRPDACGRVGTWLVRPPLALGRNPDAPTSGGPLGPCSRSIPPVVPTLTVRLCTRQVSRASTWAESLPARAPGRSLFLGPAGPLYLTLPNVPAPSPGGRHHRAFVVTRCHFVLRTPFGRSLAGLLLIQSPRSHRVLETVHLVILAASGVQELSVPSSEAFGRG
jgi:hypothetical protein